MGNLKRRLQALEVREADATSEWVTPIEVQVYFRAVQRYQVLEYGKEPPPYSREEIEAMRQWDLETIEGRGVEAQLRDSPGWQSEEARELLDSWVEGARRRLEASEGLPPERWHEVWGVDEKDEEVGVVNM